MAWLLKNQWLTAVFLVIASLPLHSQRIYTSNSVLASGDWYQISVDAPGVYRIDLPLLAKLGLNTSNLSANAFRLYGNGGFMLPENPGSQPPDDLTENAVFVSDGGDGQINGNDYILFYAPGPHRWLNDSVNRKFSHIKNLYADRSYYYITFQGTGKRIQNLNPGHSANTDIISFNDRFFHELDTVNFLSSGKNWYGEELSNTPGKSLSINFVSSFPNLIPGPASISTNVVARSFNTGSRFGIAVNGQPLRQLDLPPVGNGIYDAFAQSVRADIDFSANNFSLDVSFSYSGGAGAQGWLDWFGVFVRRRLTMAGVQQLGFRDWNSVAPGNNGRFTISDAPAGTAVWDVTDVSSPRAIVATQTGTDLTFSADCGRLREYVAFNTSLLAPVPLGRIQNQNLHGLELTDYLVITHTSFMDQAVRLAQYHQQRNRLKTVVVTTDQVYNEFSSGTPDPVALRDFIKMFYDRAGGDSILAPKYLLLFGDGSFDYRTRISGNTNYVPVYESAATLEPLETYTSDDFFGFLGDEDDINVAGTHLLDIGIGRIPAATPAQAKAVVDKIIAYTAAPSLGSWRSDLSFVADDEDNNLHLEDAEIIAATTGQLAPNLNIGKIYLDAFPQQSLPGGSRYPAVNQAIISKIYNGTLLWNYSGHGGARRLADEVVLDQDIINSFNNQNKLPLFITATCDFAPHDNPLVASIGENLLLRERTGAIALMTTTRLVFAFSNRIMNQNYLRVALQRRPDSTYKTLGEAVRSAKNLTYQFSSDIINNRKFTLLGDPAVTIGYPQHRVSTTAINGSPAGTLPDTLKAMAQYTVSGEITDASGSFLNDFNGTVYPVIYDKTQDLSTLANDPGSPKTSFSQQNNIIFKGKATVNSGRFTYSFVVPKDINYQFGAGRINYYAENGTIDAGGSFTNIIVGGTGSGSNDNEGPAIRSFLNDEKFIDGGISNNRPLLLLKLADSSGVNIMGTGTGHDLVVTIDNDPDKKYVLNEFYTSDKDNYKKGEVRFQLPELADGPHSLSVKAWDVMNNSNEASLAFRVQQQQGLMLEHVLNYPNPFTTRTSFWFDHNRPGEELQVNISIYTVTGKLVKTLRNTIITTGTRSNEVEWNGRDEYGSKIGRGVYIYRLTVKTSDGQTAHKMEKLYIL
ncbi:MAG: type IX secretion system sortase PorU [Chitinophagaceae bacterium]|nr:MAG: type IX secretion system sortase PorU [Chitinophagaceae bacterium]